MTEQLSFQIENGGLIPTSPLQLFVKPINKETASICYKRWHYLGNKGFIQIFGFGAYYDGVIQGAISYHQPSAVETVKGLFNDTNQNGIWEIGRLAMSNDCPKNSESRFIAISIKLLRKLTNVKAILTYADSGVGHVGTIYKASGFKYLGLTDKKSDFWIDGKIQERGKTKGIDGTWIPRSQKHKYIKIYDKSMELGI